MWILFIESAPRGQDIPGGHWWVLSLELEFFFQGSYLLKVIELLLEKVSNTSKNYNTLGKLEHIRELEHLLLS